MFTAHTLISACQGDQVAGRELAEVESDLTWLTDLPQVQEFFRANNYDDDHPHECMYLTNGWVTKAGWPTLTVARVGGLTLFTSITVEGERRTSWRPTSPAPEGTVPAAELLDLVPADEVEWCTWDDASREAPHGMDDLADHVRSDLAGSIQSENGFTSPTEGLSGLLAALADEKVGYLVMPGSYQDGERWHDDDDGLLAGWKGLLDSYPQYVVKVTHWDLDRYHYEGVAVRLDAFLPRQVYDTIQRVVRDAVEADAS